MKILLTLFLFTYTLFSSELGWSNDYNKALKMAEKEHKLVYVLITSKTCQWCKKFEATTLQDKKIQKRLYSEFVTVNLLRDRDTIPKEFETAPIPRHYFVDSKGKILYSSLGHRGVICFDAFMDNAQEKIKVSQ